MAKHKEYPLDFVTFYKAYPKCRHEGYVLPYRSWERLVKNDELPPIEKILKAVEHLKTTRKWIEGFVPMMSTFLNQRQWESSVVDDDLAKEIQKQEVNEKKQAFISAQQALNQEWLKSKESRYQYIKYNTEKLLGCSPERLGDFIKYIVYNDICLAAEDSMGIPCMVKDLLVDCHTKAIGKNTALVSAELDWLLTNYFWTIMLCLLIRHSDSNGIDIFSKTVKFNEKECLNTRRILHILANDKACEQFRKDNGYKGYIPASEWLLAFKVDDVLMQYNEVI